MKKKLPKVRKSNELFIRELMTQSIHGALTETFIIEAVRYYCEKILSNPEPEDKSNLVINPRIWWNIAKELKEALIERFEKKEEDA
jgi:hypothetical protein